jgi:hypothetical protein
MTLEMMRTLRLPPVRQANTVTVKDSIRHARGRLPECHRLPRAHRESRTTQP